MNVLIVGSGGREHALAWKISQSKRVEKTFCAPGNGGIKKSAELVDIKPDDIDALIRFCKDNEIDLTIVGPEAPLANGIVDRFLEEDLKIFGPTKDLARLEGSKIFAKETMKRFGVPTADFRVFTDPLKAKEYLKQKTIPIVVKADGLAAGKGVVVAKTVESAENAIDSMMIEEIFGDAGKKIIIEECLEGEEVSILAFSDGKTILPLVSSQDHKRIFDNDRGPNTGGMGAYSPSPLISEKIFKHIIKTIFRPVIEGLAQENKFYNGILYAGLMMTKDGPNLLEFNVRFGDPETQSILPLLKSDLVDAVTGCIENKLDKIELKWYKGTSLCVIAASKGYPGSYEKHKEIYGLESIKKMKDIAVFHSGTVYENGKIFTNGGRVLGVTGFGKDIKSAKDITYEAIEKIKFEGMYYRKDIGDKATN